ncbi:CMRF35-like molecule 6, partial [Lutra lutra]|uniref:CMRF35-like molecule 6 n=1 Tax=Lutra lutra TaxID=9657 RepID=UPI001FD07C9A
CYRHDPGDGRLWLPAALLLLQVPVTLENLTESDTGTYRCGIDTSWLPEYLLDLNFQVVLSVTPGLHSTLPDPMQKTTISQESPSSGQHPGPSPKSHPIEDQASKGEERSLLSNIYFRLLVFLEVPLVLSMLSAVL